MKVLKSKAVENRMQSGFTLVELLIVVMVLGILAMIIVPQITVSTVDAKKSTLVTNLGVIRNAIELYYHQHDNTYPGVNTILGAASTDATASATAFVAQLTQYTNVDGTVATAYDETTASYGPYLKSATLPANPFNDLSTVICDITETDITERTASGTSGWKFYTITGNFIANIAAYEDL